MSFLVNKLRSWKWRIFLALFLFVGLFLTLLPVAAKYYLASWLTENGADTVEISDIDINLFTGTVSLKGIDVRKGEKVVFEDSDIMVDIGIKSLLKKEVLIENAGLKDVIIDIEQSSEGKLRVASYSTMSSAEEEGRPQPKEIEPVSDPWTFTANKITLENVDVRYAMPDLETNTHINHLSLERFSTGDGPFNGRLEFEGTVNGSPVKILLDELDIRNGIDLSGKVSVNDFVLGNLSEILRKTAGIDQLTGQAGVAGDIDFTLDRSGKITAAYTGSLELHGLDLAQQGNILGGSAGWQGETTVQLENDQTVIQLDGNLGLNDITALLADQTAFSLRAAEVTATTDLHLAKVIDYGGEVQIQAEGFAMKKDSQEQLKLASLSLHGAKASGDDLFSVDNIVLEALNLPSSALQANDIGVKRISIPAVNGSLDLAKISIQSPEIEEIVFKQQQGLNTEIRSIATADIEITALQGAESSKITIEKMRLNLAGAQNADVDLQQLTVSNFSYDPDLGTIIESFDFELLNADYTMVEVAASNETVDKQVGNQTEEKETGASEPLALQIGSVMISKDSVLRYRDETLPEPFSVQAEIDQFQVSNIDLKENKQPVDYVVKAMIDTYGRLEINGRVNLAPQFVLDQQLSLKNYPAIGLSPFVEKAAGNRVESGRLQFLSNLKIDGVKLESENQVTLNEFQTHVANDEQADIFNAKLPLPLGTALYMLRDDDETISLSIPLRGELGHMRVGVQDILTTALTKSLTVAVTPYLAYTFLGPTGALVYLGARVGKSLLETDLPDIQFDPGIVEIGDAQIANLDSAAESLKKSFAKDEKNSISICAKVLPDEAAAEGQDSLSDADMRKKLFELGDARSMAVRTYLVEKFALDAERFNSCSPGILFEKGKKPYVQFMQ